LSVSSFFTDTVSQFPLSGRYRWRNRSAWFRTAS